MKVDDKQISIFKKFAEELSKGDIPSFEEWERIYFDAEARKKEREKAEAEARLLAEQLEAKSRHERMMDEITAMDLPLSFENPFIGGDAAAGVTAQNPADGLILSMHNLGCVDIEYIAAVCGLQYKEVILALKGSIYQNPETWEECFYKGWEVADSYLSGNLLRKYRAAKEANEKYDGYFSDNMTAIKAVMPPACSYLDIYVMLGSPWIPPKIIDKFIEDLFGIKKIGIRRKNGYGYEHVNYSDCEVTKVRYESITGTWYIPDKNRYGRAVKVTKTYGTDKISALYILEKTLNMQAVKVFDEVPCPTNKSGKKKVVNSGGTIDACEKQQKLMSAFQGWVWQDESRRAELERIYDETYGAVLRQNFDGSFLTFPNLSLDVKLRKYQKNAVAKILFTPNVLLAHEVGSGKTFVMIAAGMELRRIGISKKNMYVVPNNILGQWREMFLRLYPKANILTVSPKDFTPTKRQAVLRKIKTCDYDAVLIAYSSFELIPLSRGYYKKTFTEQLERVKETLQNSKDVMGKLFKRREKLEEMIREIDAGLQKSIPEICFDDLGINTLFVDEAHNFKNITIQSKIDSIMGMNKTGSAKCNEMLDKVRHVQKSNNGRGVVFATGTPITNSITDAFVMQTYLQYGELKLLGLELFDSWAGMFAEKVSEFEIDVTTSGYRMSTRFARFHNLPELTSIFSQIADFLHCPKSDEIPAFDGYTDKLIAKTKSLTEYIDKLSQRADLIRRGVADRTDDNMLKITTDGRKAALDIRLTDNKLPFSIVSKVYACAETVTDIYRKTNRKHSTQVIFCDYSVPNDGFNLYDELKRLLVNNGLPTDEIAFIHDYDTDKKRMELFGKMNGGKVRVLVGSTFKLGIGVNVQRRLVAVHHLDVPWRPSDMVQREGRILRQGNENKRVEIFRYICEGSFDAYSWQLLETKQRFIVDLLSGFSAQRSSHDVDNSVLSYAEVKALAIGNPLIKKRIETVNELTRINALNKSLAQSRSALRQERERLPQRIAFLRQTVAAAKSDILHFHRHSKPEPTESKAKSEYAEGRRKLRKMLYDAVTANVLRREEKPLCEYQGFTIVLPSNMISEKPFVWLKAKGRYRVELAGTETGNLIRIDNRLETLSEFIIEQSEEVEKLTAQLWDIKTELAKEESYADQIAALIEQLEQIDKQLGVNKK